MFKDVNLPEEETNEKTRREDKTKVFSTFTQCTVLRPYETRQYLERRKGWNAG